VIRVVALTSGKNLPASRFRVRQFIEPLRHQGINVRERHLPVSKYVSSPNRVAARLLTAAKILGRFPGVAASRFADVTWFERELIPGRFTLEAFSGRPRLFDVDDALWLLPGGDRFSERIVASCDGVIAGNEFLADHYRKTSVPVWVVPTSIDTDVWTPRRSPAGESWVIGWIGTSSNLPHLCAIEPVLRDFLRQHPEASLLVVCDQEPVFPTLPGDRWRFERWSSAREVGLVQTMDVGLMPLPDTDSSRGKCSCKMLSYMAAGIPVVVSPVGTNREILERGQVGMAARSASDWKAGLEALFQDRSLCARLGAQGRAIVEAGYSVRKSVVALTRIFREVTGS